MRYLFSFLLTLFVLFFLPSRVFAVNNPLATDNNRFGIHIIDPVDLEDAASLVNSSEGDWGYVTFVIRQDERNSKHWQEVFNKARRLHLIPIVRVATRPLGDVWEKPSFGDIDGWVSFFNSLNWVVKNRYVTIGNEPNHAKEWGGEINPEEYAKYLTEFSSKLKSSSDDYFILPAGFDASAANSRQTMDEVSFIKRMLKENSEVFAKIDGWASHSYPNPAFSGPANGFGRGSVRTFDWELTMLKSLGLSKELPVFITETGWEHNGNVDSLAEKYAFAFNSVWKDERIVAVTPFVLSYLQPPFESFSWRKKEGSFYPFYDEVKKLTKVKGNPTQEEAGSILAVFVPPVQLTDSSFTGIVLVKNEGQSIWPNGELTIFIENNPVEKTEPSFESLEPNSLGLITFTATSPREAGLHVISIDLRRLEKTVSKSSSFQLLTVTPLRMKIDGLFGKIVRFLGL